MFTKAALALVISLGVTSGALAATKQQHKSSTQVKRAYPVRAYSAPQQSYRACNWDAYALRCDSAY
jgi:hypothetical protein